LDAKKLGVEMSMELCHGGNEKAYIAAERDRLKAELANSRRMHNETSVKWQTRVDQCDALAADRDQISLTLAVAKADRDKWFGRARDLQAALTLLYDKWENGDDCYEDPERFGGFLGKAFKLNEAEENQVLALIGSTPETVECICWPGQPAIPSCPVHAQSETGENHGS
jgi:hypothetical protein